MNNLEFALEMKNKRLASGLSQGGTCKVLPMYQDIVSTALRTEKPTQVKKHRTLSCVV